MKSPLVWATVALAAALTALATWVGWAFLIAPMENAVKTANLLATTFENAFQTTPRISINQAVVISQNTPVLELVTLERQILVRHSLRETWMHSTKEFEIEAAFTAKAGIPLREEFTIDLVNGGRRASVRFPRAKLLSLEMGDLRILRDEDGLWNKLTAKDRERAIRDLRGEARRQILSTDFLPTATEETREQIAGLLAAAGSTAVFTHPAPPERK